MQKLALQQPAGILDWDTKSILAYSKALQIPGSPEGKSAALGPCRIPPSSPGAGSQSHHSCSLLKSNHFSPPSATVCSVTSLLPSPRASGNSTNLSVHSAWYHALTTYSCEGPFSRARLQIPNPCTNTKLKGHPGAQVFVGSSQLLCCLASRAKPDARLLYRHAVDLFFSFWSWGSVLDFFVWFCCFVFKRQLLCSQMKDFLLKDKSMVHSLDIFTIPIYNQRYNLCFKL